MAYSVIGVATGCIYALTASGLVVTYTTSGIFNFAHGAIGMLMAFTYWQLTVQNDWPQWLGLIVVLGVIAPALGALIPVAPLLVSTQPWAIWTSFAVAMLSHFAVGAARSAFTGRGLLRSGMDMFLVGLGVAVLAQGFRETSRRSAADHRVFGAPPATVFHETYDGPPVVGRNLTRVPALAPLEPGNRTHEVRVDVVTTEIEIAPGVRYRAWTFGGAVPGPVLHVREGDRVVFTMKNRSDQQVSVTAPAADASPFLASLAADTLQKASPVAVPSVAAHAAAPAQLRQHWSREHQ